MTQYALVGHKNYYFEISHEQFRLLKEARSHLFEALSIEDKFNLVLENYAEFEQEVFSLTVKGMLFYNDDWSSGIDEIHVVNRRIINLLKMCRLYIDQTSHNIHSIYGSDSEQEKAIEGQKSQEYDSDRPGYRVMEAMRNYVQHRELPIDRLSKEVQKIKSGSDMFTKHTIRLHIDIKTLKEDKKFKRRILTELEALGESVEFAPLIRQYLASIGTIHFKIRELLSLDLSQWEEIIEISVNQYREFTSYIDGLQAVSVDESKATETVFIFDDVIKRRRMLEDRSRYLTDYSSHFVSSEAPGFN